MTFEPGTTVRTTIELLASDGSIVPVSSVGVVIGGVGDKLLVEFDDMDLGTVFTAAAEPWELRRLHR